MLILQQLNRAAEGAEPTIGDLAESKQTAADADCVVLMHRESRDDSKAVLVIPKVRQGAVGRTEVFFDGGKQEFTDSPIGQEFTYG